MLNGAIVFADVVYNARDAERASEAQQVSHETKCNAEDERSAEGFSQGLPDPFWTQWCCALRSLEDDTKKRGQRERHMRRLGEYPKEK